MFSLVSHPGGPDDPPVSATDGDFNHTRFFLVQHSSNLIQHSYGKPSCQKFAKHMFRCSGTQGCLFIIKLAGCLMLGCPIHVIQLEPCNIIVRSKKMLLSFGILSSESHWKM